MSMSRVTVTAAATGPLSSRSVLTSVDVLGGEEVAEHQVMNSWALLGRLPGVQLTETGMGAESGKATFRAFNGEGYLNGIKVLIDGIPSNVNSGNQRFIDMVLPLDVERIEVVRGTNDPRWGLHAIGGHVDLQTRQGGQYTEGRLSAGTAGLREGQLAVGRESDGLAQNYILGLQQAQGYRRHAASDKLTLGGKWFYSLPGQGLRLGLVARAQHHEAEEPGFLTATQMAEDRRQSPAHNAHDGDEREMRQLSGHLDWALRPTLHLSTRLYLNRYEDDRRVTFTGNAGLGNSPRQRRQWDETQQGVLASLTWRASPALVVEGGLQHERQDNTYRRDRYAYALPTDFDTPASTSNDDRYTLNHTGLWSQVVLRPAERWRVVPGLRLDHLDGDTLLRTSGVQGELQKSGWIRQPKLSVLYTLAPQASVYANWGRTFQVLTGSRAPAYLTATGQATFAPSINTGRELGVKFEPLSTLTVRGALWRQDATDEVANMPSTGTTVGLGRTRRQGVDLQARWTPSEVWLLWTALAWQEARVVQAYTAAGTSLAGREVFATPRHVSQAGLEYRPDAQWRLGLQARAQGDYYIDDLNAQGKWGAQRQVDLSVRRQLGPQLSVDLEVKNLTDREQAYVWYDSFFWPTGQAQPMFSPAAPRTVVLSLHLRQ
ncbi:TonB-dependent receptor [Ideonella sp. TBM-1]|uniref:TonB-dependent receptor n=2 Tax=Ideonella livida TaxID=2707176 RepID=A0A7C9PJ49_9BURK|nr:TonB-dependent receptor [Ideonella livida]